jgi:hypothetical protein
MLARATGARPAVMPHLCYKTGSSLKRRNWSGGVVVVVTVLWSFPACLGRGASAAGVQAQRPQRSEDERPGVRRGWRNTDPAGNGRTVQVMCSCRVPSSWFAEDQFRRTEGFGCRSSLRRWERGMRRCGSSQGGINQGGDHATTMDGSHDPGDHESCWVLPCSHGPFGQRPDVAIAQAVVDVGGVRPA